MAGADVVVRFIGDTAQLQGAMRQVESTGDRMRNVGRTIAGAIGGAAVVGAIVKATQAASSLNETVSKSEAIFGKSAKAVDKWASGAADDFAMSKQGALEAAATFGNMFDQLGTGEADTVRMSKRMTELATDFASFHDADISQVIEAQTAAFRGEYDALQKFVPTINAAAVETKALEQTGKENAKALTAQEKAAATYTLMIEGAGKALGDYDRTADSAANQQRKFAAQMADLQATVGQALLPVLVQALGILSDLAETFQKLPAPVQQAAITFGLLAASLGALSALDVPVVAIFKSLSGVASQVGSAFVTAGLNVAAFVERAGGILPALAQAGQAFVRFGQTLLTAVMTNPILLAIAAITAAVTAFAVWSAMSESAVQRANKAGQEWGRTLVTNAQAVGDTKAQLQALQTDTRAYAAGIEDTRAVLEGYQKVSDDAYLSQTRFGIGTEEATRRAHALELQLANMEGTHKVLREATDEAKEANIRAEAAERARQSSLREVAASTDAVTQSTKEGITAMQQYANQVLAAQGGWVGYEAAQLNAQAAEENLQKVLADPDHTALQAAQASNQLTSARLAVSASAIDATAKEALFAQTLNQEGVPGLEAMRATLVQAAQDHGDNTGAIAAEIEMLDGYIAKAKSVPPEQPTTFTAETATAIARIDELNREADYATRLRQIVVNVVPGAGWGTLGGAGAIVDIDQLGAGGIVSGARGSPQLVLADGGETVLPTHTMGAEAAIAAVMGGGSSSSTFNITVQVPLGAQAADVGAETVDAIRSYERRNGKSWRSS